MGNKRKERNKRKRENKKNSRKALKEWQKKRGIFEYADGLKKNMYGSEKWFLSEFIKQNLSIYLENNVVIGYYIADFVYHKLVIEVDGSVHNNPEVKEHDRKKDIFYKRRGYTVIRVEAYCQTSFNEAMKKIRKYLGKLNKKVKNDIKTTSNQKYIKEKKDKENTKRQTIKSSKKNRCSICHKAEANTTLFYMGKKFKVCSSCKQKHKEISTIK